MPAPESDTEPASVECTRMTFDGTELTESQTKRKIYSRHAIAEDTIFQVHQVGGFPFAIRTDATVHAHVRVPDPPIGEEPGIAGGATVMCEVISYSDGRDVVSTGPIADRNNTLEVTNWKTERRGETNNHELLVEPWGDGWRIYDEDFTCPDDSGGP